MIVTIRGDSIDISEIPLNHYIEWESLLNDLKGGAHPRDASRRNAYGGERVCRKSPCLHLSDRQDSAGAANYGDPEEARNFIAPVSSFPWKVVRTSGVNKGPYPA
jgi:hypothetical protein